MAVRQIRTLEDDILHKKSREIAVINDHITTLLDDMAETMREACGLGLAAVQVGVLRRAVVIDVGEEAGGIGLVKMVNPVITSREGSVVEVEGCLSVPGYQGMVERPEKVSVEFTNENGEKISLEATGLFKKAICHELDHLDGIVYTDIAQELYEIGDEVPEEEEPEEEVLAENKTEENVSAAK